MVRLYPKRLLRSSKRNKIFLMRGTEIEMYSERAKLVDLRAFYILNRESIKYSSKIKWGMSKFSPKNER